VFWVYGWTAVPLRTTTPSWQRWRIVCSIDSVYWLLVDAGIGYWCWKTARSVCVTTTFANSEQTTLISLVCLTCALSGLFTDLLVSFCGSLWRLVKVLLSCTKKHDASYSMSQNASLCDIQYFYSCKFIAVKFGTHTVRSWCSWLL